MWDWQETVSESPSLCNELDILERHMLDLPVTTVGRFRTTVDTILEDDQAVRPEETVTDTSFPGELSATQAASLDQDAEQVPGTVWLGAQPGSGVHLDQDDEAAVVVGWESRSQAAAEWAQAQAASLDQDAEQASVMTGGRPNFGSDIVGYSMWCSSGSDEVLSPFVDNRGPPPPGGARARIPVGTLFLHTLEMNEKVRRQRAEAEAARSSAASASGTEGMTPGTKWH